MTRTAEEMDRAGRPADHDEDGRNDGDDSRAASVLCRMCAAHADSLWPARRMQTLVVSDVRARW